jgi:fluoride exporter
LNGAGTLLSIAAISAGASLGAVLRWILSVRLNPLLSALPLGTLAANLIGGYAVGVAVGWLGQHPEVPPQWRLFVVTGLLGGLTTFSTFSAEVVAHLEGGRIPWALVVAAAHLSGSLLLTALGIATYRALAAAG